MKYDFFRVYSLEHQYLKILQDKQPPWSKSTEEILHMISTCPRCITHLHALKPENPGETACAT